MPCARAAPCAGCSSAPAAWDFRRSPASSMSSSSSRKRRPRCARKHYRNLVPLAPGYFGYSVLRNSVHSELYRGLLELGQQMDFPIEGLHEGNRRRRPRGGAVRRRGGSRRRQGGPLQDLHQGVVPASWPHGDLHGQMVARLARPERPHSSLSARARWQVGVPRSQGAARHERDDAPLPRRPAAPAAGAPGDDRADRQFLSAAHTRLLGADRFDLGRGEPHLRATLRARQRELAAHGSQARRRRRQSASGRSPPLSPRASMGSSTGWSPTRPCAAMRTSRPCLPSSRSRPTLWDAAQRLKQSQMARNWFGDAFVDHFAATREWEEGIPQGRSRIGSWRATSRSSDRTHHVEQVTVSPVDGRIYVERAYASPEEIDTAVERAVAAQHSWRHVPVSERAAICERFVAAFEARRSEIAEEISWQIGRPISACAGRGARHRRESPLHDRCRRRCPCGRRLR